MDLGKLEPDGSQGQWGFCKRIFLKNERYQNEKKLAPFDVTFFQL